MTRRDTVACAVWDTLGSDYTFEEALNGGDKAAHAQAIAWVREVADTAIRAIAAYDNGEGQSDAP